MFAPTPSRLRSCAALCTGLLLLSGCAIYEPAPLAMEQYASDWPLRELNTETVRQYAEILSQDERDVAYDPSDGLSLCEAEAVALFFNPQLRLIRAQANVPLATAREAGWWPDPEFEAEVMRVANRGSKPRFGPQGPSFDGVNPGIIGPNGLDASGVETTPPGIRRSGGDYVDDPWIIGTSLSITIPISGRLAVEQDWAWATYHASWRRILIAEWELLTRLRSAWLAWSSTREQVTLLREYINQLSAVSTITERLASVGELKPTEARVLLIELRRQTAALHDAETLAETQRLELLAMLGLAPETPVELQHQLFLPKMTDTAESRRERLLNHDPRILAVQADYDSAEERLRLEVRKQIPDLNIGPGYSFEEGRSRLGFGLGFALPLWNHNRQAIAEARAERDAAKVQAEATIEQIYSELARAEWGLNRAIEHRRMLLDDVAPLTDQQVAETHKLLELGEGDVLVLRDALTNAMETKLELLSATLAEAQAASTLQQMLSPRWITPAEAKSPEPREAEE